MLPRSFLWYWKKLSAWTCHKYDKFIRLLSLDFSDDKKRFRDFLAQEFPLLSFSRMATAKITPSMQLPGFRYFCCSDLWHLKRQSNLQTTQRNESQCHPQPFHLENQLHVLHSECSKTKPSNALYLPKWSSICTTSPHSLSVSALLWGAASTLITDGCNKRFWAAAAQHQEAEPLLQALWGSRKGDKTWGNQQQCKPDLQCKLVDASHLGSSPLPCG